MKKKCILIITMFMTTFSIYSQVQNEYEESSFQGKDEVNHKSKVSTINSHNIGETIKIGNLEIMKKDLGKFNWDDGNTAISELGNGWRLPTIKELNMMYQNRKKIGGFDERDFYCSSTYNLDPNGDEIWCFGFTDDGEPNRITSLKLYEHNIRAVRTIK